MMKETAQEGPLLPEPVLAPPQPLRRALGAVKPPSTRLTFLVGWLPARLTSGARGVSQYRRVLYSRMCCMRDPFASLPDQTTVVG